MIGFDGVVRTPLNRRHRDGGFAASPSGVPGPRRRISHQSGSGAMESTRGPSLLLVGERLAGHGHSVPPPS